MREGDELGGGKWEKEGIGMRFCSVTGSPLTEEESIEVLEVGGEYVVECEMLVA